MKKVGLFLSTLAITLNATFASDLVAEQDAQIAESERHKQAIHASIRTSAAILADTSRQAKELLSHNDTLSIAQANALLALIDGATKCLKSSIKTYCVAEQSRHSAELAQMLLGQMTSGDETEEQSQPGTPYAASTAPSDNEDEA